MARRQQALADVILKDEAVESLSSFIGVDGTNTTLNSGRIQINLKPLGERGIDASAVIRRLQPELATVSGITLYMQPVQDLTVEDRVSRTQYQYTLEDPDAEELGTWAPKMVAKLKTLPELRDVASDAQDRGLRAALVVDRDTASRLGITPAMIDQTLYDAFGQRQVSVMFTQLNQYHVVLEVMPEFQKGPKQLQNLYLGTPDGGRRSAPRAHDLPDRVRHRRAHRHHPADRHRQEERDHDDRLRARRRAQSGSHAARLDLPGVSPPLPTHHDDDDGRAARRPPA